MSIQTALDNIHLRPTSHWGHTEYSLRYHKDYFSKKTGLATESSDLLPRAYDQVKLDFNWSSNDGLIDWKRAGRITDMGHASYAADSSDQRSPIACPFNTAEEVWEFDAVKEYGLPDFNEQVKAYEDSIRQARREYPNLLTPGGYYLSIVSGAIQTFGWEMLLLGASDPAKMERVFDSFFQRTLFFMKAWAKTSVEAVIQHEDFVWTSGLFMNPEIYRKVIIPRYAELWKPLHAAGKKVLFCSDGLIVDLAMDVAKAGADGFIFEPCNDFDFMADRFGSSHCLIGSFVDCRDLTFGKWARAKEAVDKTFSALKKCKGAIVAVGNHLPPNIPAEMLDNYFDYMLPKLAH
jgi:hypothetical protein